MRIKLSGAIIASIMFVALFAGAGPVMAAPEIVLTDADDTLVQPLIDPGAVTAVAPAARNWIRLNHAGDTSITEMAPRPPDFTISPRIKLAAGAATTTTAMSARPDLPPEDPAVVRIRIERGAQVVRTFVAELPGDADRDGIPDAIDECLDEPEDFDGFRDTDGCLDGNVPGIDVSDAQGAIDWNAVFGDGYDFAYVKATEGTEATDANFQTNMVNGRVAGLLTGAYHFARPDLGSDAASEAQQFLAVAGNFISGGHLKPVLHLECGAEMNEVCTGDTILSSAALSQWVNDWISTVQNETKVKAVLYVNRNYANNHLDNSVLVHDLWISDLTNDLDVPPDTGIWDDWHFWQYSDQGVVSGITGDVNLDTFKGDVTGIERFTIPETIPLDPNCDGRFNIADVIIFLRFIVGQIPAPQQCE